MSEADRESKRVKAKPPSKFAQRVASVASILMSVCFGVAVLFVPIGLFLSVSIFYETNIRPTEGDEVQLTEQTEALESQSLELQKLTRRLKTSRMELQNTATKLRDASQELLGKEPKTQKQEAPQTEERSTAANSNPTTNKPSKKPESEE